MKKLLSLALVLTMLFTIISVPSVSAATMEVSLVKADLSAATTINDYTVSGTDAGKIANPSLNQKSTGTYTSSDGKKYNNTRRLSLTTPGAAGIGTALGIASDEKIIKISQDANTSILRFFMGDGSLSAKKGDVIKYKIKVYYTDFVSESGYTKDGVAVPATKMETVPETWNDFQWGYLKDNKAASARTGLGLRTVATNQWVQLEYTYEITSDTDADLTSYGFAAERYSYNALAGYKNFPSTIYLAQPEIVNVTEVTTNKITAVKLGEGTVTGTGDVLTGETATLTATPAEGYHFAGWYKKTASAEATACLSTDATYTFKVEGDTNVVAAFEKDEVNSWVELLNIPFDGNVSPSTGINFWGKTDADANVNNINKYVTYEDEGLTDVPFDGGENLLKFDKSEPGDIDSVVTYSTHGMAQGRINNIPGYYTRFETGKKYKMSTWIYIAATEKEKQKGDKISFVLSYYMNNTANAVMRTATATVGEWSLVEAVIDSMPSNYANASTGFRIKFVEGISGLEDENADMPTVAYFDNLKYEKFDGLDVTATAENGVVYGTGEYLKGESVTLNAGADAGYKFAGYYTEDNTLLSAEPKYTFTVTADTNVVAKFTALDAYVKPSNVIYSYGSEDNDIGIYNTWTYYMKADGTTGQTDTETYNKIRTYKELAKEGIYKPYESAEFGSELHDMDFTKIEMYTQMAGRFRGWEGDNPETKDLNDAVSTKYKAGKQYKFTWWVNPVSMQPAKGETTQPETTSVKMIMQYSASANSKLEETFTLNVGEWNKLEWVFTANETMTQIAPGLRFDWTSARDSADRLTTANRVLFDALTVEEIVEWNWSDTKNPNAGYFRYLDGNEFVGGTGASNRSAFFVEDYTKHNIPKAPGNAGSKVIVFDYKRPDLIDDVVIPEGSNKKDPTNDFEPKEGSAYYGKTYAEAYEYVTRLDNAGPQIGARFNEIAPKGVLHIGKHYKISCMVYIPEKKNISTGETVNTDTSVRIVGVDPDAKTASGSADNNRALGDGKDVYIDVPVGKWTEVGYIFKATEAGASIKPSIKVELSGIGIDHKIGLTPNDVMIEKWYIDDVKIENVHVDDLALVIDGSSETEVVATATVNDIKEGNTLDAIVIIAAYDANGKLVGINFSNENGASAALAVGGTLTATYTKDENEAVDKYVAFLWNDLDEIRPYVKPATFSVVTEQ